MTAETEHPRRVTTAQFSTGADTDGERSRTLRRMATWEYMVWVPRDGNWSVPSNSPFEINAQWAEGRQFGSWTEVLNFAGSRGWELMSVTVNHGDYTAFFKREVAPV